MQVLDEVAGRLRRTEGPVQGA
eukprot:COSAG02_NODE_26558_length_630_cov_1.137476_2_plen_21_part_01